MCGSWVKHPQWKKSPLSRTSKSPTKILMQSQRPKDSTKKLWGTSLTWCIHWWRFMQSTLLFTTSTRAGTASVSIQLLVPSTSMALSWWRHSCILTTDSNQLNTCRRELWPTDSWTRLSTTCFRLSLRCRPCTGLVASETMLSLSSTSIRDTTTKLTKPEESMPLRENLLQRPLLKRLAIRRLKFQMLQVMHSHKRPRKINDRTLITGLTNQRTQNELI